MKGCLSLTVRRARCAAADAGRKPLARRSEGSGGTRRSLVAEGFDAGLVVGPAGLDLDPDFQEHLGVEQLFQLLAGFGADALEALAPWPITMALWPSRSTTMVAARA
jgi:hypothetical protein